MDNGGRSYWWYYTYNYIFKLIYLIIKNNKKSY